MVQMTRLVPPDGGYGWVIVGAYALHHFIAFSLLQGFGLIFKDKFKDIGLSQTDTTFIITTNAAFTMFLGILLGPLLKKFGYKKLSLIGAIFMTVGVTALAFGNSFTYFLVTYGFITATGRSIGMSSYVLALNTFFLKKRNKAAGYTITIWGLGQVLMPQVYSLLLGIYGVSGAVLIVGAITAHTFVGCALLQPVEKYMKKEIIDEEVEDTEQNKLLNIGNQQELNKNPTKTEDIELQCIDSHLDESRLSLHSAITERSVSISSKQSSISVLKSKQPESNSIEINEKDDKLNVAEGRKESVSVLKESIKRLIDIFDLTLLSDTTYVNIALGLSFSFFAEQTFVLLTPFILQDFGLSTQQIATLMSIISTFDICFRFLSPYAIDFFKKPVRVMFIYSLIIPILSKFSLLFASNYTSLLCCAVFLGVARGLRVVYFQLIIPAHVPIDRLASAIGIQSTFSSIFICIGGPFLGFIKDVTGSFIGCILVINSFTFLVISMWTIELLYKHYTTKKQLEDLEKPSR